MIKEKAIIVYITLIFNIHFYFEKQNFHSLDFEQFTLNGPADSTETDGGACTDQFTVTVSTYFG